MNKNTGEQGTEIRSEAFDSPLVVISVLGLFFTTIIMIIVVVTGYGEPNTETLIRDEVYMRVTAETSELVGEGVDILKIATISRLGKTSKEYTMLSKTKMYIVTMSGDKNPDTEIELVTNQGNILYDGREPKTKK